MRDRILYVDDDEAGRYVISSVLRRSGFDVLEAATASEALAKLDTNVDLVLLDVNLPDMNGFEVCRRIKQNHLTSAIPVLHISATEIGSDATVLGLEGGADAYLVQPIEPRVLVATVRAFLRARFAEKEKRVLDRLLAAILNNTTAVIYIVDQEQKLVLANRQFEKLYGKENQSLAGRSIFEMFSPEDAEKFAENNRSVLESGKPMEFEESVRQGNGIYTYFSIKVPLFGENGKAVSVCGISSDVTERIKVREELTNALHEKEMLLQEIHHRVKNNLQVISSLLSLQTQDLTDPGILDIVAESRNRIRTMALIHEHLHQSTGSEGVDLTAYLQSLVMRLVDAQGMQGKVHIQFHLDPVYARLQKAVPFGLIANEVVSSAFKHASTKKDPGSVVIHLTKTESKARLEINDDGPPHQGEEIPPFGLKLVGLLAQQINGEFKLGQKNGTFFQMDFEP